MLQIIKIPSRSKKDLVPDVGTADEDEWYEVLDQAKQVHVPHEQTHVWTTGFITSQFFLSIIRTKISVAVVVKSGFSNKAFLSFDALERQILSIEEIIYINLEQLSFLSKCNLDHRTFPIGLFAAMQN
jgi:hypothetical protein